MKYGLELSKRSVPEWRAYNLDYNEIKRIIKRATSTDAGEAEFDKLYHALMEQYDSVRTTSPCSKT